MSHALKTGGDRGYLRIATEEAFATREQIDCYLRMVKDGSADQGMVSLWGFYARSPSERATLIIERLLDLGEQRIRHMDETGIDRAILALTAPGAQALWDVARGQGPRPARQRLPRRAGRSAAGPLRRHDHRCPAGPGLVGGRDRARRASAWLQGRADQQPHPRASTSIIRASIRSFARSPTPVSLCTSTRRRPPDAMIGPMLEAGLDGAIFGFGVEVGLHLLRLITSGIFDRYPQLQIMVGHMGEALPFWLYRLDYMHQASVRAKRYARMQPLQKTIPEYLRSNVLITTSGVAWAPAILFTQQVVGEDRVMYAMDYPYQFHADEVRTHDNLDIPLATKKKLMQTNAERWFKL